LYRERKSEIGLIILDLSMPGLSGYETFVKLREINTAVNIILSSGYSEEEVHRQFAGEQVTDFLSKPYDVDLLINKVRHHLRP
jgi:DNA-binding response OmpR family regulator